MRISQPFSTVYYLTVIYIINLRKIGVYTLYVPHNSISNIAKVIQNPPPGLLMFTATVSLICALFHGLFLLVGW